MPAKPESETVVCPACGRQNVRGLSQCYGCSADLSEAKPPRPFQFSLAQLFAFVTLCAAGMGLFVLAPGLGALACVLALFASPWWMKRFTSKTAPPNGIAVGLIVLTLLATGLAFFIRCASTMDFR